MKLLCKFSHLHKLYNLNPNFLSLVTNHETLSDALQRDAEISSLKDQCQKYKNTIKVQETTIINMGYDTKNIQMKKVELQVNTR